ncbi:F-box protein CPR1-like [Papaver somniferum]|uniref:F-box protein CPR1-like n=1 Tax=Papaver somniferum TaxID=3469 RepID=UPI000E6FF3A5|nr:F-box protein CPR1-like [Papaver somniferum]
MSSLSSLPEEVQVDIFLRLPDNSILACRCVCKRPLGNLLYKPSFIKNHLNLSIQSNRRFMLTIDDNKEIYSINYDPKSASSSRVVGNRAIHVGYPFWDKNIKTLVAVGSCNGLICLGISSGRKRIDEKSCICVWNPLTGEYKIIEVPVNDLSYSSESSYCVRYGFGYDNNIDDYKLVRILDNEFRIYNLGSKSWKTIQCTERYMFPGSNSRLNVKRRLSGVLHNGALHWLGVPTQ